jgi:hypothetical protein
MVENKEMLYHHCFSTLEYAIRTVKENQVILKLSGTHNFLAYVHNVNLLEDNIESKKKNRNFN